MLHKALVAIAPFSEAKQREIRANLAKAVVNT